MPDNTLNPMTGALERAQSSTEKLVSDLTRIAGLFQISAAPLIKILNVQDTVSKTLEKRNERLISLEQTNFASKARLAKVTSDITALTLKHQRAVMAGDAEQIAKTTKKLSLADQERLSHEAAIGAVTREIGELKNLEAAASKTYGSIIRLGVSSATLLSMRKVLTDNWDFNKTLKAANSSLDERRRLWADNLAVQVRTGANISDLAEATEQLRQNGLLYHQSTERGLAMTAAAADNMHRGLGNTRSSTELTRALTTVDLLRQGLGLTAAEGAKLAVQAYALNTPFTKVADTLATILDRTSLTTSQMSSLSDAVYETLRGIGREGSFDTAIRDASALEDALRKVGASAGAATEIIRNFSDLSAKGGLAMAFGAAPGLGLGTDEMTAFIERVGKRLEGPLEAMRRNPGDWSAMIQFEALARQLGLTKVQARDLTQASKFLRQAQQDLANNSKSMVDRFYNQQVTTGQIWATLLRNIKGLIELGLRPLTYAVAYLNDKIADLREWMRTFDDGTKSFIKWSVAIVSFAAMGAGFVTTVYTIGRAFFVAGRAMLATAMAMRGISTVKGLASAVPAVVPAARRRSWAPVAGPGGTTVLKEVGQSAGLAAAWAAIQKAWAKFKGVPVDASSVAPAMQKGAGVFRSTFSWFLSRLQFIVGKLGPWGLALTTVVGAVSASLMSYGNKLERDIAGELNRHSGRQKARELDKSYADKIVNKLNDPNKTVSEQLLAVHRNLQAKWNEKMGKAEAAGLGGDLSTLEDIRGQLDEYKNVAGALEERISRQVIQVNRDEDLNRDMPTRELHSKELIMMVELLRELRVEQARATEQAGRLFHEANNIERANKETAAQVNLTRAIKETSVLSAERTSLSPRHFLHPSR
jgi:hypothetical protein